MILCSTNNPALRLTFAEAVEKGMSDEGGLFMPVQMTPFRKDEVNRMGGESLQQVAFEVLHRILQDEIPELPLRQIIDESLTFPIPLRKLDDSTRILELFHGPTLAFKDVGARFMARMLAYLHRRDAREVTVLVATSGDTGSAVALGFAGISGTRVVLLYPSGRVSRIQEQQMTTVGGNVVALEIDGTFDDCQGLVKQAFGDREVLARRTLSTANSINCARLFPQVSYYFYAISQLSRDDEVPVFSVPSGNLGNLTAGLLARELGLPVKSFIAACNANDVLPEYLRTGVFRPRPSVQTIANAMDVGNPSNFARLTSLFGARTDWMTSVITGVSCADNEIRTTIREVFRKHGYVLDPHAAVAYHAWDQRRKGLGVVLATAHPAKFADVYDSEIGAAVDVPERLRACMSLPKQSTRLSSRYADFQSFLIHSN